MANPYDNLTGMVGLGLEVAVVGKVLNMADKALSRKITPKRSSHKRRK